MILSSGLRLGLLTAAYWVGCGAHYHTYTLLSVEALIDSEKKSVFTDDLLNRSALVM
jgi:hypothetical protein